MDVRTQWVGTTFSLFLGAFGLNRTLAQRVSSSFCIVHLDDVVLKMKHTGLVGRKIAGEEY